MPRYAWLAAILLASAASARGAEPLVDKLLRLAGLTANPPAQTKAAGDEAGAGDVWLATPGRAPAPLTTDGGYRSPLFSPSDGSVLALKDGRVVRILRAGGTQALAPAPGVAKLVGVDPGKPDEVVVLSDGPAPLAVLSLTTGRLTPLAFDPASEVQQRMLAQVRGQDRTYGALRLYIKTSSRRALGRTREWTDVYLRRAGGVPQNVSACDGSDCGEPALSADGTTVAFIRARN